MDGRTLPGRRLRVIGREPLTTALDIAVSRALRRVLPEYDAERVEAIQDDVRRSFGELLRANGERVRGVTKSRFMEELERSRDSILVAHRRAEEELRRLQETVECLRAIQVDSRLRDRSDDLERSLGFEEELTRRFADVLARAAEGGVPIGVLTEELVAAAGALARDERERAASGRAAGTEEEIQRYQRRIDKLTASLARTEDALKKLSRLEEGDAGIASIYRTVQGLSEDELELERKRELLAEIFSANLLLQKAERYSPPR
jgi:chaperonin cofactor prefoldin